jgi:hypothetical protein
LSKKNEDLKKALDEEAAVSKSKDASVQELQQKVIRIEVDGIHVESALKDQERENEILRTGAADYANQLGDIRLVQCQERQQWRAKFRQMQAQADR